ncbi:guanylate-binding protein 1-like [Mercenaria mercenaria]|uniref:guanylate-binding protein 1-like n=1 Tax=Mercenaria mercenaria TaxID=6596 RepID=UPI00234F75BF|nr:guanylate-binding protein 1-like [Mercenaria mercenaria]
MNSTLPDRETLYAEIHDLIDQASDEVFEEVVVTPTPSDLEGCTLEERFGRLDIFKRPVLFIYTDDASNNLKISETVIEQISNIDVPLNVVAVCGLYRTGKSYLMNRLANEREGFALGSTVQSETKGIWAWCKPHPKQKDQVLLLLDTEGLGDVAKGDTNHDNKMFSLTLLLCSTLIYNNTGVFNQEALDKLAFITELTESIKVTSSSRRDENEDLMGIVTPMFIMCLRDFYLELKSTNGKVITEDEYFEECLANSADEKGKDSYNKTRSCIKRYFPRRKCFTLAQPVGSKKLARIEQLDDNALDEDFVKDVTRLQEFVYDCEPKFVDGMTQKLVDGPGIFYWCMSICFRQYVPSYIFH